MTKLVACAISFLIASGVQIGKKDVSFIGKWLHEFDAERRIEGDHFIASFALGW